ncbi:MAG: hypothetical protein RR477_08870, partial [Raoultibacter sp.]
DKSILEVRIVGINHATDIKVSDDKPAGLSFMATHRLPATAAFNLSGNNTGGWHGSPSSPEIPTNNPLRTRMQPGGSTWKTLPTELTGIIKPVKKLTNNVNGTIDKNYVGTAVTSTDDYLWLPSRSELAGDTKNFNSTTYPWTNQEGMQYEFFQDKVTDNDGANNTILKNMNLTQAGAAIVPDLPGVTCYGDGWWQRSCYPDGEPDFLASGSGGYPLGGNPASDRLGVVLGFSL